MLRALFILLISTASSQAAPPVALERVEQSITIHGKAYSVHLPVGYILELLSDKLKGPRLLSFATNGDLFIGAKSGNVYRIPPPYTQPQVLLHTGGYPHSIAFRPGEILIAKTDGVYVAPYQPGQKTIAPKAVKLLAALPGGGGHSSRTIAVGPDDRVYASLGITSNCSAEYLDESYPFDKRRGGVLVLDESNGQARWQSFASGLRNPVGFAWHPQTKELYASNNGPDHHGFDLPPEYFSRLLPGSFHGMPWFWYDGEKVRRDDCIDSPPPRPIADVQQPVVTFASRNAPMGVVFVPTGALDKSLEHDAIVALRGSWGTQPFGSFIGLPSTRRHPQLVTVRFDNGEARWVDELVTGFQLANGDRWARPVGVAIGPDGALYFSSDSETHGLFRLRKQTEKQISLDLP